VIFLLALLLFGASRLPQIGKALGTSIREFKKAVSGEEKDNAEDGKNKDNK
jgi:sec-independent protein translocase protein TatA